MEFSKYKVGDKVKIGKHLVVNRYFGTNDCVKGMLKYRGKEATITYVIPVAMEKVEYQIDLDKGHWSWTAEMFEEGK